MEQKWIEISRWPKYRFVAKTNPTPHKKRKLRKKQTRSHLSGSSSSLSTESASLSMSPCQALSTLG